MAKNVIFSEGSQRLELVAAAPVVGGKIHVEGDLCGVVVSSEAAGSKFTLMTKCVVKYAKTAGDAPAIGAKLYYDSGANELTTTLIASNFVGVAMEAAVGGDAEVVCRMNESAA